MPTLLLPDVVLGPGVVPILVPIVIPPSESSVSVLVMPLVSVLLVLVTPVVGLLVMVFSVVVLAAGAVSVLCVIVVAGAVRTLLGAVASVVGLAGTLPISVLFVLLVAVGAVSDLPAAVVLPPSVCVLALPMALMGSSEVPLSLYPSLLLLALAGHTMSVMKTELESSLVVVVSSSSTSNFFCLLLGLQ